MLVVVPGFFMEFPLNFREIMSTLAKKILLARHCSTGEKYRGRFIGATDLPVGADAPTEVERLAGIIGPYAPAVTFCSPFLRVRQTVELLVERLDPGEIHVEYDLREIDFGRWEGKSFSEIAEGDSELVKRWSAWNPEFTFPEGEKVADFLNRTRALAEKLAAREEQSILVVAHGGVVRALLCHLLKLPPQHYLLFDVKPARLATLDLFPEGGVLTGLNL
jgi:alpha-ribazole phosphatase